METSLRQAAIWDEVKDRLNKSALGMAQYLADAILCYEKAATKSFQQTDRALIEQIVQEYLEKQTMGRTRNSQKEEPSISSPPIDLIASALADFRG